MTLFTVAALGVFVFALVAAVVLMQLADGPERMQQWLTAAVPYFLVWRLMLYAVFGSLYVGYWRPRLRARQADQADGGEAAHGRLVRAERLLLVAIVVIEAANAPELIAWLAGG